MSPEQFPERIYLQHESDDPTSPINPAPWRMWRLGDADVEYIRADLARPTPSPSDAPDLEAERSLFEATCYPNGLGLGRSIEPGYGHEYDSAYTQQAWRAWQARAALPSPAAPSTLETRARQLVEVYDKEDVYWAQLHIPEVERLRDALDCLPAPGEKGTEEGK